MPLPRVKTPKGSLCSALFQGNAFSFLHNALLPLRTKVSLSILEPSCGELPFGHHLNLVPLVFMDRRRPQHLGSHAQYQVHLGPLIKYDTNLGFLCASTL
jgi:hypothetical protein